MKKSIVLLLGIVIVLSLSLCACNGQTTDPVDPDPLGILSFDEAGWKEYGIPESFDLRSVDVDGDGVGDRCFVTGVRFQNPYGTCWGFAAIAASEISILGSILIDDPDAYKTLDLSEKQFTYFVHTPFVDEDDPQNGEGITTVDGSNDLLYGGGFSLYSIGMFAQGVGLSEEWKEDNEILIYRGENGYTIQRYVDGEFRNYCYSSNDEWSIPEEYRNRFDYLIKEAMILPTPAAKKDGEYEYDADATEAIKLQLLQRRGVDIAFYADQSKPDEEEKDGKYLSSKWAHYTYEDVEANHAVTIVGYDDHYAKENFVEGHQPPEDGAWLVKNSWGSGEVEFPNKGNGDWGIRVPLKDGDGNVVLDEEGEPVMVGSGYFWLSYYDQSLLYPTVYIVEKKSAENDYRIDQHDRMPLGETDNYASYDEETKMANVFKATGPQILDSISVITPVASTVQYSVYLLCNKNVDPEEGLKVSEGEIECPQSGFYRVKLPNQTYVQEGQRYSVVVTISDEDNKYYVNKNNFVNKEGEAYKATSVINEGESYVCENGVWRDYKLVAEEIAEDYSEKHPGEVMNIDNFSIKALSYPLGDRLNIWILDGAQTEAQLGKLFLGGEHNTKRIVFAFEGDGNREMGKVQIEWGFIEEDQDFVSVESKKGGSELLLTAQKAGAFHLMASVEGIGTTIVRLEVVPYEITEVKYKDAEYTGEALTPEVTLVMSDGTTIESGEAFSVEYADNVACGVGKLTVKPVDLTFREGVSATRYFQILPPAPEFESIAIEEGKLVGTIVDQSALGVFQYFLAYAPVDTEDWEYKLIDTTTFSIELEEDCDYIVKISSLVDVRDREMDEEMIERTYDDEDDTYTVQSAWSDEVTVSATAEVGE